MPSGHDAAHFFGPRGIAANDLFVHDVVDALTIRAPGTQTSAPETKQARTKPSKLVRGQRCSVHGAKAVEMAAVAIWHDELGGE